MWRVHCKKVVLFVTINILCKLNERFLLASVALSCCCPTEIDYYLLLMPISSAPVGFDSYWCFNFSFSILFFNLLVENKENTIFEWAPSIIITLDSSSLFGAGTKRPSDHCKLATIKKWLNTDAWQSKTIYGLFLQFSLTLVKLMTSLKLLLENRSGTS